MTMSGPVADEPAGLTYAVKLQVFEGPLDLLLHLIRINEVEITEIRVSEIAGQYIEYLSLMHDLNLDVASEYLVMAATLAWIKSRMILPPSEEADEEEGGDPRAELIARLLEYQRFKEVAEALGENYRLDRDVYSARPEPPERTPDEDRELTVSLVQLLDAFRRVLKSAVPESGMHEVERETVTVRDRMAMVMKLMAGGDWIEFYQLFEQEGRPSPSRQVLVATFLAVLELVRLAAIRVFQNADEDGAPDGPIRVRRIGDESADAWNARIAEIM